jgi:hypothetical protein
VEATRPRTDRIPAAAWRQRLAKCLLRRPRWSADRRSRGVGLACVSPLRHRLAPPRLRKTAGQKPIFGVGVHVAYRSRAAGVNSLTRLFAFEPVCSKSVVPTQCPFAVAAGHLRGRCGPRGRVGPCARPAPRRPAARSVRVGDHRVGCSHQFLNSCRVRGARFLVGHPLTVEIANIVVGLGNGASIPAVTADEPMRGTIPW